jgi:hypothetical protein
MFGNGEFGVLQKEALLLQHIFGLLVGWFIPVAPT